MALKVEEYVIKGNEFVALMARHLQDPENLDQASRVTISVLHALRDILTPEQSIHLIAQLPLYIKAAYVDGWVVSPTPLVSDQGKDLVERLQRWATHWTGNILPMQTRAGGM